MWYVLGFLLLLALANAFVFSFQTGQTVSYSDFKTLVREGKVQEVTVAEDRIRGMLKQAPARKAVTSPPSGSQDPKLTEELEKSGCEVHRRGCRTAGLAKCSAGSSRSSS